MSGDHPEAKAACRDTLDSPSVGFRAGLCNIFQRCLERIVRFQAPGTPSIPASQTSSSKKRLRPVSKIEEENYVARQVREIYRKLTIIPSIIKLCQNRSVPRLRCPPRLPRDRSHIQTVRSKILRQQYILKLPLPLGRLSLAGAVWPTTSAVDLTRFIAGLPDVAAPTIKKTNSEDLIGRMFPSWATSYGARHVGTCFWSWLCVLDGKLHHNNLSDK